MEHSTYEVKTLEQMRALSNKIRVRILNEFRDFEPRTNKQIADLLQLPASKVHYHVRELARVGLLRMVNTKEKGGVVEKYYLPIAKQIRVSWTDWEETEEQKKIRIQMGHTLADELFAAYRKALDTQEQFRQTIRYFYLTEEEAKEFYQEAAQLFGKWTDRYSEPRDHASPWRMFCTLFPDE
jgi:DNA-binding transcriptional ArsR family regulator